MSNIETQNLLKQRWLDLKTNLPHLRARNAAALLNVSEGELLACRCDGIEVIRLQNQYEQRKALLESLIKVGQVMTITRNEFAVHEKIGFYSDLQLKEHGGGAFDSNINLRIYFNHWGHMFAVQENGRKSIQIFDHDGTSSHKIYLTQNGDESVWNSIIAKFTAQDQSNEFTSKPAYQAFATQDPKNVDVPAMIKQWRSITDLHQFWFLLRDHQLERLHALQLAEEDLARRVDDNAWRDVFQQVEESGLPIMVFVRSPGVAQIHTGAIHRIVEKDGWFNILDPSFNLHLQADKVAESWVVYRPDNTGGQTSLEMYDADGQLIFHLFSAVNLQAPELKGWRTLLNQLPAYQKLGKLA